MNYIRILFFIMISLSILFSCKKEYSLENGGSLLIPDTTDNNCKIEKIIKFDYFSRVVEYGYISTFTADHKVSSIQLIDSIRGNVDNNFVINYTTGKIQVDVKQYFVTGADGKVIEFHGYEYPEDTTSDRFKVTYSYNTAGQLIKRTEEYDLSPGITSFEMYYTYTGNNLTRSEAFVNNGNTMKKFITVAYEYDVTKTIKSFIYQIAVAPEIFYFQTAIDAGSASANPLKKATTTFINYNSGQDSTTIANFVNYAYDSKSHVNSFEVTGGDFAVNNLYAGKKYVFRYSCY